MSVNSKSMSKISDDMSEGSFNNQYSTELNNSGANVNYYSKKKKNKK